MIKRAESLTTSQKKRFEKLLRIHHDVFAKDDSSFGLCPWVTFRIDTQGHPPIKKAARPIPLHYRKAVYDTIMKYLDQGCLVTSQSPWASPIPGVPKKDGSVRVAVDYRALNEVTRVSAIPIPRIKEILQKLVRRNCFTPSISASDTTIFRCISQIKKRQRSSFQKIWNFLPGNLPSLG